MIKGNELIVNYLRIIALSGAAFYGFILLRIHFGGAFTRISSKKVHENGSEIAIFIVFSVFLLGAYLSFRLTKRSQDPAQAKEVSPDRKVLRKGHKTPPLLKGKGLLQKKEYLRESRERDERKNLIGSLDDNDNF